MRLTHGIVLLALAVGYAAAETSNGGPATTTTTTTTTMPADPCVPPPGPDITVAVSFSVVNGNCKMSSVPKAYVCSDTKSITWAFKNACPTATAVTVQLGPRKGTGGNTDDPLNATEYHPPSAVAVDAPSGTTAGSATIFANVTSASNDCYTYTIGGTHPADPEIEVRRGTLGHRKVCPSTTTPRR